VLKTLKLINSSSIVKNYEIQDFKEDRNFYFLKLKITFIDDSILFVKEFVSQTEYLYSFHWQDKQDNLLIRWDNYPHHKEISTFPHHKHSPKLEESFEICFDDVFTVIRDRLS
jgi:hypothetical protein